MNCPKCGKELLIKDEQVGLDENGNPIYNEYAICKDCKKKWNLDKQKAKKQENKPEESQKAPAAKSKQRPEAAKAAETKAKQRPETAKTVEAKPKQRAEEPAPKKKADAPAARKKAEEAAPRKKADAPAARKREEAAPRKRTEGAAPRKRAEEPAPRKKVRREAESPYSNIPPEEVRSKREKEMRRNYDYMLAQDDGKHRKEKSRIPGVIITILILLLLAAGGFFGYKKVIEPKLKGEKTESENTAKKEKTNDGQSIVDAVDEAAAKKKIDLKTKEFEVIYDSHTKGTDAEGKEAVLITFQFTNKTDAPISPVAALAIKAFQNEKQCVSTTLTENETYDNLTKDVEPDASVTICVAFNTMGTSEVDIQVENAITLDGKGASQVLTL